MFQKRYGRNILWFISIPLPFQLFILREIDRKTLRQWRRMEENPLVIYSSTETDRKKHKTKSNQQLSKIWKHYSSTNQLKKKVEGNSLPVFLPLLRPTIYNQVVVLRSRLHRLWPSQDHPFIHWSNTYEFHLCAGHFEYWEFQCQKDTK